MRLRSTLVTTFSTIAFLSATSNVAFAADMAAAAPATAAISVDQDDIVISTAPGIARPASELISHATAIDRDALIDDMDATLGDTLDNIVGVSSTRFTQGARRPILRGLGAERVQVLTNGIGAIDASAASPDHQIAADGLDAEKIEILRGAAALAYGGQAIGGVINVIDGLIAEKPVEETIAMQTYSAYNSVNEGTEIAALATFQEELDHGVLIGKLSFSARDLNDFNVPDGIYAHEEEHDDDDHDDDHDVHEEELDFIENSFAQNKMIAAGLSYVHDDKGFFGFALRRHEAEYGIPGHAHHEEKHDDDHDEGERGPFIELDQLRLDIRTQYIFTDRPILNDITGSLTFAQYEHVEIEDGTEIATLFESQGYESRVQLRYTLWDFDGAAGVQVSYSDFEASGEEAYITPTQNRSTAAFLYETREWDNGMGVEGGLRLERVRRDNVIAGEKTFDLFGASLGVHRHVELDNAQELFVGAEISLAERAPNQSELFANGAHLATAQYEIGNADLNIERGINTEATIRWQNEHLEIGGHFFHSTFDDFIYLMPGFTLDGGAFVDEVDALPVFVTTQQNATFTGAEIHAHLTGSLAQSNWDWGLGASFETVHAEFDDNVNVPFLPPQTVQFEGSIENEQWVFDAHLEIASAQDEFPSFQTHTDGYATLDLGARYNLPQTFGADTSVFIQARNVTDEEIRYATSATKEDIPGAGRNIRVGINVDF